MYEIDEKISSFKISTDDGTFNLDEKHCKYLVIFFFPKADTSGCTKEAKEFTEIIKEFENLNTLIIGISKDKPIKLEKFRKKYDLKCLLGSDENSEICENFGVWVEKSMYGRKYMGIQRSTFIIGEDNFLKAKWEKVSVNGHAKEVLETIKNFT
tara:strand:- start:21 stop:482 length:462 start_codon:yes stop_codon:yes gene_type:complete